MSLTACPSKRRICGNAVLSLLQLPCNLEFASPAANLQLMYQGPRCMSVLSEALLRRFPSSESVRVAAAAVLARESKQKDALALLEDVQGREVALTRAQLALDVGNAGQVGLPISDHHCLCVLKKWSWSAFYFCSVSAALCFCSRA